MSALAQRRANVDRIAAVRRAATHCAKGHEFTPENTYRWPGDGRRRCRTCRRECVRDANQARKLARIALFARTFPAEERVS